MKVNYRYLTIILIIFLITIVSSASKEEVELIDIDSLQTHERVFLAIGETYVLDDVNYHFANNDVETEAEDLNEEEAIIEINENVIKGLKVGTTIIHNDEKRYDIEVSDMFTYPHIDGDKDEIPCGFYSEEDNEYLDLVLATKIADKGYGTRAGCVEAARFLLLQFPYKLHYFGENGRLPYVDGEGRYHHIGLYLNIYKAEEENLYEKSKTGPAPWGCYIYNTVSLFNQRNSLDCSGFVTWALLNGGCDPGDIGAGPNPSAYDCSDLGEKHKITYESLDEVKVGDLFAEEGHIAIVIGKKDDMIYIAESNCFINVRALGWTKEELINSAFYAWIDMDEFYNYQDGKLTDYWE